jgi:DNA-binding CsgD family transcriptional regulator
MLMKYMSQTNGVPDSISMLPDPQRDCLRLVLVPMTSKQIGRRLDISPHTVDQRIKLAMRRLGVASRVEAAQMLAAYEQAHPYQPLVYQSLDIAPLPDPSTLLPLTDYREKPSHERIEYRVNDGAEPAYTLPAARSFRWPFPSYLGEKNNLPYTTRLLWICTIAALSALTFGMILAGLEALSRLI